MHQSRYHTINKKWAQKIFVKKWSSHFSCLTFYVFGKNSRYKERFSAFFWSVNLCSNCIVEIAVIVPSSLKKERIKSTWQTDRGQIYISFEIKWNDRGSVRIETDWPNSYFMVLYFIRARVPINQRSIKSRSSTYKVLQIKSWDGLPLWNITWDLSWFQLIGLMNFLYS